MEGAFILHALSTAGQQCVFVAIVPDERPSISSIDPMLKGGSMRQVLMIVAASMLLMISSLDTTHARVTSGVLKGSDLIGMKVE